MAIKQTAKEVFNEGRGGGRGLPVTAEEDMARENEVEIDPFPMQDGLGANEVGGRPITVMGDTTGFHTGRGPGRGYGPETPKNA